MQPGSRSGTPLKPSRLDRQLLLALPPLALTVLAALFRLPGLGHPARLIFDETYYVKDAYTLLQLGYEARWPSSANDSFNTGLLDVYTDEASFVVHPPLGKWIIALGMMLGDPADPASWRIGMALLGTLAVPLIYCAGLLLTRSVPLAAAAGFLFAIDGNAIVMSRIGLLDTAVMFFGLAGFICILLDRRQLESRFALQSRQDPARPPTWWHTGSWRWWLLAAGISFGLASAVKWSGLYFLAVFGVFAVLSELQLRLKHRPLQKAQAPAATLAHWFGSAWLTFFTLVPAAALAHLATWTGWFASSGGWGRNWAASAQNAASGWLSWIPESLQSWWHYQSTILNFHTGVTAEHPYEAAAWTWPFLTRPTLFFAEWTERGEAGCDWDRCGAVITDLANPLIWWLSIAAVLLLAVKQLRRPVFAETAIVTAFAAGYLPWLFLGERTVYQFYSIGFQPFLILALAVVLGFAVRRGYAPPWQAQTGAKLIAWLLLASFALTLFWWPLLTGAQVPHWFWQLHIWLPTWS